MIKISKQSDCCGCTACASICSHKAINMLPDTTGFLYPEVDISLCVDCGLCEKVCPIIMRQDDMSQSEPIGWYAARHQDKRILNESTSGGVFPALAKSIVDKGGIVFGVAYNERMEVIHSSAETYEDCKKFVGSKYVQSNVVGQFQQIRKLLREGRNILFTGTPCQVAGLRAFLRKDYDNLLTVDIICHAVPSPKVFSAYIEYAEEHLKKKLVDIRMRDKQKKGWGHSTSTRFVFKDGSSVVDPPCIIDWNSIYFSSLINRPSCSECRFCNIRRPGDLTIGDFWDDYQKRPDLFDKNGTSLVLTNTTKGHDSIIELNDIVLWTVDKNDAMQYNLQKSSVPNKLSDSFKKDYDNKGIEYAINKYVTRPRKKDVAFYLRKLKARFLR